MSSSLVTLGSPAQICIDGNVSGGDTAVGAIITVSKVGSVRPLLLCERRPLVAVDVQLSKRSLMHEPSSTMSPTSMPRP
jgi:hypothetical protein